MLLIEKGTGTQWCMENAPKKYNTGAERVDDQMGGCDICGVWRMQLQRYQNT